MPPEEIAIDRMEPSIDDVEIRLPPGVARAERSAMRGELRFVTRDEAIRLRGALDAARLLVVTPKDPGPGARGRLSEAIDEAIECALRDRGAAAPGIGSESDADAALSDQLYRARKVGRVGIAIDLAELTALVDLRGVLDPEDGDCLLFLARASRERPIVLMLDRSNATIRVYGSPKPLAEALGVAKSSPARAPDPARVVSAKAEPRSPLRPLTTMDETRPLRDEARPPEPSGSALFESFSLLGMVTRSTPLSGLERAFLEGYAPLRAAFVQERLGSAGVSRADARAVCSKFSALFARAYAEALPTFGATGRHPRMVFQLFDLAQRCARVHGARSTHVVLVDAMRWDVGTRLRAKMAQMLAKRAVCVEEQVLWAMLPTTTSVQLDTLVRGEDALRAPPRSDLEAAVVRGRSVDLLRRVRIGHRDVMKLDLIEGRLRDPAFCASTSEGARLDALADDLCPILSSHVASAAARSLVVLAGDHGFAFGSNDDGAQAHAIGESQQARQGGASPDEVFVPFIAWLVDGVH